VITKEVTEESFFNFFKSTEKPTDDSKEPSEGEVPLLDIESQFDVAMNLVETVPYSLETYLLGS